MSEQELLTKIEELRSLQRLIEDAAAEAEGIKDAIKQQMKETEELRVGDYRVMWKTVASSKLNTKALKAALPDLYSNFCIVTKSRRFTVS